MNIFKKIAARVGLGGLSKHQQYEIELASTNVMLMIMINLQIETTYGLTHRKVSFMMKNQADELVNNSKLESVSGKERLVMCGMAKNILEVSKQLDFEAAKQDSKTLS